ncbi:MAG: LysR family transcriptional regulator [Ruminococcaceae bacterium]|nr:LysR family transcriptional regulator [Oscillospiraceae bacterium]
MDIKRLEEFCVLAGTGSFRETAEILGISQPLLSNHIGLLEKRLGTRLLERNAHSVTLTEAGSRFLGDAREIIQEYSQIINSVGNVSKNEGLGIRIGFSGFIIPSRLGPFLDTVNLQYPNIDLELFDDRNYDIEHSVREGEIDIFFSYAPEKFFCPGIVREEVYNTKALVLVPLHHHLAHKSSLSLADIDGERFVLYPQGRERAYNEAEREILLRSGISFSLYEGSVSPGAHFILVPVGKGLALCPRTTRDLIPPNTVALPVIDPNFEMTMYMFYSENSPNPYVSEFVENFRTFRIGG